MTTRDASLESLFDRIAAGDSAAMEDLFRQQRTPLFRFFLRLCRCENRAADLLQNTFLNLWRYRNSVGNRRSAAAYLYKVALNQWRQSLAGEKRQQELVQEAALTRRCEEDSVAEEPLVSSERRKAVWQALECLPDRQKEAFVLHRFDGLSCRAIAEATGESTKTIESRLRLALLKLTKKLAKQEDLR